MNNILTFEDYKKMNIRQVESVIYRQFIEEDIEREDEVNEGFIRDAINKSAGKFIQNALADEIEKGKELEKSIKEALDGLNKGFEELESRIDADTERGNNASTKLSAIEKVKEAIKAVQSQAFDTLTMIGSEGEIDFAGFMGSASVAAAANFGILFSPIRSVFMTRKAYKYFLGIIKQTIRRNLLIIQLNFDQFENLILQKSFESEEDSEFSTKIGTLNAVMGSLTAQLCDGKNQFLKGSKNKELKDKFEIIRKNTELAYKQQKASSQSNPLRSLWEDQHNNTYTRTLEQIKQYINDDSQKELDALKNSITKMAGNDVELGPYGELLISAAEEYAIHTNHGINNNFIKMSSVFNLENQKKLIELIKDAEEENKKEIARKLQNKERKDLEEKIKEEVEEGKKLYDNKIKGHEEEYSSFDKFNDSFEDNDQKCLREFFQSEEGKDSYEELIEKNPLYKYLIFSDIELTNTFFNSMGDLKIVKVTRMSDFDSIVNKDKLIYSMMAEKSIKNALESNTYNSKDYFGFNIDSSRDVKGGCLIDKERSNAFKGIIEQIKTKETIEKDGEEETIIKTNSKPRYFLTFSGDNIFNILHNDFKTKIFKDTGEYESDISLENKKTIVKLINKHLHIGNNISSQLAEYLVRLEAHMLLKNQKPYFVVKNDKRLLKCFDTTSNKIVNKNAFVEIRQEDYEKIEKFLLDYDDLRKNDFNIKSEENQKEENK
jgi:hypothetical protein